MIGFHAPTTHVSMCRQWHPLGACRWADVGNRKLFGAHQVNLPKTLYASTLLQRERRDGVHHFYFWLNQASWGHTASADHIRESAIVTPGKSIGLQNESESLNFLALHKLKFHDQIALCVNVVYFATWYYSAISSSVKSSQQFELVASTL